MHTLLFIARAAPTLSSAYVIKSTNIRSFDMIPTSLVVSFEKRTNKKKKTKKGKKKTWNSEKGNIFSAQLRRITSTNYALALVPLSSRSLSFVRFTRPRRATLLQFCSRKMTSGESAATAFKNVYSATVYARSTINMSNILSLSLVPTRTFLLFQSFTHAYFNSLSLSFLSSATSLSTYLPSLLYILPSAF